MDHIAKTNHDQNTLNGIIDSRGLPKRAGQPADYAGFVVIKPWGYEFEVFDNRRCSIWMACLRPGQSVSMHCHQTKSAMFLPLSEGVTFKTLLQERALASAICVEPGVFHSQENHSDKDAYFLEYEWPSDKADLVRLYDRYGRETKGYEGVDSMVPISMAEAAGAVNVPEDLKLLMWRAA